MNREMSVSGLLGETFDLLSRNGPALALFVLFIGGATALGEILGITPADDSILSMGAGFSIDESDTIVSGFYDIGLFVLGFVANYLLQVQFLASTGRLQHREMLLPAYIGMSLVSLLGVIFGLVLLFVPGIILMVRWSAASGFLISERVGVVDSLSMSWEATSGHSWQIFFGGVVLFLSLAVAAGGIWFLAELLKFDYLTAVVSGVTDAIGGALSLAFGIAVFCLLHENSAAIAEVFE